MEEYSTKDIARLTDLAESTVRKYAQLLEKNGYSFLRSPTGSRIFTEQDIKVFLELKATPKEEKSIEEIASDIANKYTAKVVTSKGDESGDTQVNQVSQADMLAILMKQVTDLTDTVGNLTDKVDNLTNELYQERKYINERDRKLMESIRLLQEEKQARLEMAATQEKKKGFLARLFGGE